MLLIVRQFSVFSMTTVPDALLTALSLLNSGLQTALKNI